MGTLKQNYIIQNRVSEAQANGSGVSVIFSKYNSVVYLNI